MAKAAHIDDFEEAYDENSIAGLMARVTPEQQEEANVKMLLASKIYKAMKGKGWSQTRFAEVANQHVSVISKWISGTHNFTVGTLVAIQRMLGVQLLDLDEGGVKSIMDVKVTVSSNAPLSEEERHKVIFENGGMAATIVELYTVIG
jgi:transcriptional regulator with XRE-family HTH domain